MFGIDEVFIIAGIAVLYTLLYSFISGKLVDKKKVAAIQEESKQLQKELNEASKSGDVKRIESINKRYEEFLPKLMKMQFEQMKPLIFALPALALLIPFLKSTFPNFIIKLPFHLPIFIQHLENFPNWRDTFGSLGWFWIIVIFWGIAVYLIMSAYNKVKQKYNLPSLYSYIPFGKKEEKADATQTKNMQTNPQSQPSHENKLQTPPNK